MKETKNILKKWRTRRNLSQVGLAVKAEVAVGVISAIEKWNYVPGASVRERIAATLALKVTDLWPGLADRR